MRFVHFTATLGRACGLSSQSLGRTDFCFLLALQFLVNDAGFIKFYYALFNHPILCNFLSRIHQSIISRIQYLYEIESATDVIYRGSKDIS